jgi:hypothetical protein
LQHLQNSGAIVNNPNFENGIVKPQNVDEDILGGQIGKNIYKIRLKYYILLIYFGMAQ